MLNASANSTTRFRILRPYAMAFLPGGCDGGEGENNRACAADVLHVRLVSRVNAPRPTCLAPPTLPGSSELRLTFADLLRRFPTNEGLSSADAAKAEAAGLPIPQIMPDIHVNADGAIAIAEADFARLPLFSQSALNCETNALSHDFTRALNEAADLNQW